MDNWREIWRDSRNVCILSKNSTPEEQIIDVVAMEKRDEDLIESFLTSQKISLCEKIKEMKKTEASKVDWRPDMGIETYFEKVAYNYALLDILELIQHDNK